MMPRFTTTLIALCMLLASQNMNAQKGIERIDSLAGRFIKNLRKEYSEKLLVQTNKQVFIVGEELWLKAWPINHLSHKYYKHSQTLYVDLVNEKDSAVSNLLLNIPSERTEAKISLSDKIKEGQYWLRLYTANMAKRDTASIMVIPIYIINPKLPLTNFANEQLPINSLTPVSVPTSPQIEVFPEGGQLIAGTNAVIGIKATDKNHQPIAVEGYIMDGKDSTIETWFSTEAKYGLAKCQFFVSKSHQYYAVINDHGKKISWPLPAVNQYASQISLKDESPNYFKVVIAQGDSIYRKGYTSYLLGMNKDSLCFASEGSDMYEISIPKTSFPKGLSKLVLFNEQKEVISERSIYITRDKEELFIQTQKPVYGKRDLVEATILSSDSLLRPSLASLSVVVNNTAIYGNQTSFFTNTNIDQIDSNAALRNLQVLTQSFKYLGQQFAKSAETSVDQYDQWRLPTDTSITDIKGTVYNKKNQPMPNRVVTIYAKGKFNYFDAATTDSSGQFSFRLPVVVDSLPFTIQVSNTKGYKLDEKIKMEINANFPKFSTPQYLKKYFSPEDITPLYQKLSSPDVVIGTGKEWLQTVTVKSSIKKQTYNTSKRVSNFSQIITGEALQKIGNTDASAGILTIPGLYLRAGFVTLGGVTGFQISERDEPLLIIDGVMIAGGSVPVLDGGNTSDPSPVFNVSPVLSEISKINTDIIDFIEVLKGPEAAYYGTRAANGVILINTQRVSNFRNKIEGYGTIQYYPKSYHMAPSFVVPEYDQLMIKNGNFKDHRPTIYWNGHLYTNEKGKAHMQFYTADDSTQYTIQMVGLTATGDIIFKKQTIQVQ
ncbi:MAG: TonB-dependent receptor plug domain-containing protein [Sediminibacterium sp.]